MLPVLILRAEPGASRTAQAALRLGLNAHCHPLFTMEALPWQAPPRAEVDALLLGSANALRHGGVQLAHYRGMPAYAVGQTTAQAAQEAGLNVVATGAGGLQTVLNGLVSPAHTRLLRLAGRERVVLQPPPKTQIITREVYASRRSPFSPALIALLQRPAVVLLHSGEAAVHFMAQCQAHQITRSPLQLAVIGQRVVDTIHAAGFVDWGQVRAADTPDDTALLALAVRMCKNASFSPQGSLKD